MKIIFTGIILIFSYLGFAQTVLPLNSKWKYFKGTEVPSESINWTKDAFDDKTWSTGNAPFRYGDGSNGTLLSDMSGNYFSVYLRNEFFVTDIDSMEYLQLLVDYDDAYKIWINGAEVSSSNYPENATYNSFASQNHESGTPELVNLKPENLNLNDGKNTVAVHALNVSATSSDFYIDVQLSTKINRPIVEGKPTIDVPGGFYNQAFDAVISTENSPDSIVYTIDGSDPQTSASAIKAVTPHTVRIDPDNPERPKTPAFLLRASIAKTGFNASHSVTCSYIFLDDVLTQNYPGGLWPRETDKVNGHIIDLAMDDQIVNHTNYNDKVKPSLKSIPTVSIVTDLSSLFDPGSGIWVNPKKHGIEWERPASFEIINPDGNLETKANCGIRIRGGASRNNNNPKHALRLFFREEYGDKKLNYALFGDEGVDEFDKIDFRTSQNYAWSRTGNDGKFNTMLREVFSRDMQAQMGNPYTRSKYYHLYLNGMYWGIYMSQERSEARYAESYFGGDVEDYDVVKVDGTVVGGRVIEATDGTLDTWEEVWDITKKGFFDDANYTQLMGLDLEGKPDPKGTKYINAENLIDYVMIIFFTGNYDAPTNVWSKNKGVNNFYCIKNRNRKREGFRFFQHDAEHSLFYENANVGSGISENRVNIGFRTDDLQMTVTDFKYFQPQYLHHQLMFNKEYRQLFIDRTYKWFYKEKLLQAEKCKELLGARATQIEDAIIAESARWGDGGYNTPRTKDDDWKPAVDQIMNEVFQRRPGIVINQLKAVRWYPTFDAPEYYINNQHISDYTYKLFTNESLAIKNPDRKGEIIYTVDGSDPREYGGEISKSAIKVAGEASVNITGTTIVKTRIKYGNVWSAINEIKLLKDDDLSNLIISEIHYNPLPVDSLRGKDLEFIEFKNIGSVALNLSGLNLSGGISYSFPENTVIPAGSFLVVASDSVVFREFHMVDATGEYKGHLSNAGEEIIISQGDTEIHSITYGTDNPWPQEADGLGNSMVYNEENSNFEPDNALYWRTSYQLNGTPFKDDFKDLTEVETLFASDFEFNAFPNPVNSHLNITYRMEEAGSVRIKLLNMMGQELSNLAENRNQVSGFHSEYVNLANKNIASGIYLLQLTVDDKQVVKKLVVE